MRKFVRVLAKAIRGGITRHSGWMSNGVLFFVRDFPVLPGFGGGFLGSFFRVSHENSMGSHGVMGLDPVETVRRYGNNFVVTNL